MLRGKKLYYPAGPRSIYFIWNAMNWLISRSSGTSDGRSGREWPLPPNPDLISWRLDSSFSLCFSTCMYGLMLPWGHSVLSPSYRKREEESNFIFPRLSGHEPSAMQWRSSHILRIPNFRPPTSDSANISCKALDYYISNPVRSVRQCQSARRPPLRTPGELRAVKDVETLAIDTQR